MEAVSRGAFEKSGTVIGIIPDSAFSGANRFCTIVIPTGIGFARNMLNALSADVIIALGGKYGTLSELSYAVQFAKPIIICSFASGWSEIFAVNVLKDNPAYPLYRAASVPEVYHYLDTILQ